MKEIAFPHWLTVVFGEVPAEVQQFEENYLQQHPAYQVQIAPCLVDYKKPLFSKRYITAPEVLAAELPRADRKHIVNEMATNAPDNIKYLSARSPRALSGGQRLRMTMVYEALTGRRTFLQSAKNDETDQGNVIEFAQWLRKYSGGTGRVVMLLSCSLKDLSQQYLDLLEQGAHIYELWEGALEDISAQKLTKELERVKNSTI